MSFKHHLIPTKISCNYFSHLMNTSVIRTSYHFFLGLVEVCDSDAMGLFNLLISQKLMPLIGWVSLGRELWKRRRKALLCLSSVHLFSPLPLQILWNGTTCSDPQMLLPRYFAVGRLHWRRLSPVISMLLLSLLLLESHYRLYLILNGEISLVVEKVWVLWFIRRFFDPIGGIEVKLLRLY